MGLWNKIFGGGKEAVRFASMGTVSLDKFANRAVTEHANCFVPISEVHKVVRDLDKTLTARGMSRDVMDTLFEYSLIGLCPKCGIPCGAQALKSLVLFNALGPKAIISFSNGGNEAARHRNGQCANSSCDSQEMQLFWFPDLDPDAVRYFRSKGHELKDCSLRRQGVWPLKESGAHLTSVVEAEAAGIVPRDFSTTIQSHLDGVRREMTDPIMTEIIDELSAFCVNKESIDSIAFRALCAHDGEFGMRPHFLKLVLKRPARTFLVVTGVPTDRSASAGFFATKYPPGYGGYVNFWLQSDAAATAILLGHSVMAHLLVFADFSVNLGLSPLDLNNLLACPKIILPMESLTSEDRKLMGL